MNSMPLHCSSHKLSEAVELVGINFIVVENQALNRVPSTQYMRIVGNAVDEIQKRTKQSFF